MCYATEYPRLGGKAFICKMPNIEISRDGRANVELLPVAECSFVELWEVPVPGNPGAPNLMYATVKELPIDIKIQAYQINPRERIMQQLMVHAQVRF